MTLKAEPQKMTTLQTGVVLVVGAAALAWGAFGLMDYNVIGQLAADYPTVQTGAYAVVAAVGAVFLVEIFTETELLNVID